MKYLTKLVRWVDPAEGWKYGFPKPVPDDIKDEEVYQWMLDQGVPEWNCQWTRHWVEEEEDNG